MKHFPMPPRTLKHHMSIAKTLKEHKNLSSRLKVQTGFIIHVYQALLSFFIV